MEAGAVRASRTVFAINAAGTIALCVFGFFALALCWFALLALAQAVVLLVRRSK